MSRYEDDFWADAEEITVIPWQPAIAVYRTAEDLVGVRMKDPDGDDDTVLIPPRSARAVATAILQISEWIMSGTADEPTLEPAGPKDPGAAERQRRRRARQAEEEAEASRQSRVTERDTRDTESGD